MPSEGAIIACGVAPAEPVEPGGSGLFRLLPGRYTPRVLDFRYIAIDGPLCVGKSTLTERLGARFDATVVLDEVENPFLDDFYSARAGAAFQAQLFYLLNRQRQLAKLRQVNLFSQLTLCDFLLDKDKVYAYLNLDDNELFIYQRLFDLLSVDVVPPDLVIYLQTPTEVLTERVRDRSRQEPERRMPDEAYIRELNEAFNHFFFHYTATPLLVVETSNFDLAWKDEALDDLVRQIEAMGRGTQYYVPRT